MLTWKAVRYHDRFGDSGRLSGRSGLESTCGRYVILRNGNVFDVYIWNGKMLDDVASSESMLVSLDRAIQFAESLAEKAAAEAPDGAGEKPQLRIVG